MRNAPPTRARKEAPRKAPKTAATNGKGAPRLDPAAAAMRLMSEEEVVVPESISRRADHLVAREQMRRAEGYFTARFKTYLEQKVLDQDNKGIEVRFVDFNNWDGQGPVEMIVGRRFHNGKEHDITAVQAALEHAYIDVSNHKAEFPNSPGAITQDERGMLSFRMTVDNMNALLATIPEVPRTVEVNEADVIALTRSHLRGRSELDIMEDGY